MWCPWDTAITKWIPLILNEPLENCVQAVENIVEDVQSTVEDVQSILCPIEIWVVITQWTEPGWSHYWTCFTIIHVYVDWCPGSLYLWRLQPCTDIWRLKIQLSWVMRSRVLTLSRDEVLYEIMNRFQQSHPDNIYSREYYCQPDNFAQPDV